MMLALETAVFIIGAEGLVAAVLAVAFTVRLVVAVRKGGRA